MHLRFLAVLVVLTSAAMAGERPNFVFLLADDLRADAIGPYGQKVIETPHLDALAREGTTFTRAIVGYPICYVSRAEILTGCCAFRTGVQYRGKQIDPRLALWPQTMRDSGYQTWYCGKWHNDGQPREHGYEITRALVTSGGSGGSAAQPDHAGRTATGYVGWTFKDDRGQPEIEKGVGLTPDTDRYISDGAVELIRTRPREPFFLHVNFSGPHDPRIWPRGREKSVDPKRVPLPKNFATEHPFDHGNAKGRDEVLLSLPRRPDEVRAELAVYLAVVANLDEQVGRIVATLRETGQLDNTVIIFSSDHGLALGSHGLTGKQNMYDHTIGVPLVVRGPGIPRGKSVAAPCYLRDLFPTACELAGITIPETVEGRSLAPALRGEAPAYSQVFGCFTDTQRVIRDDRWKLIWYPQAKRQQLFDLTGDPDERVDLSGTTENQERLARMKSALLKWLKENGDPLLADN